MKRIDLNGAWEFKAERAGRAREKVRADVDHWMAATVPGTVHTDLMSNGKIPDPFMGTNELTVQWVDGERWLYRRVFEVSEPILRGRSYELVAEGLDTYAEIRINGRTVGKTANMFVEHRFGVERHLRPGSNSIEILFDSPVRRSMELEKKYGRLQVALEPHRVYVRKAQYSFGWDWGPKLTTSGIWRDMYVQIADVARLSAGKTVVRSLNVKTALVEVTADLLRNATSRVTAEIEVTGEGFASVTPAVVTIGSVKATVRIPNPKIWWPAGQGEQPLYRARITLRSNGEEIDRLDVGFGIRTVKLVQQKDEEGRSFVLEINGRKIFCKGADWIPCDTFLPRIPDDTYVRLLSLARDAGMNMIRVWGGGVYERDRFYELCDQLGLMVWQDFMFACAEYPDQKWFRTSVEDEALKAVTRLRNHPSVVLWCGNNECEWLFCTDNPGKGPDDMRGASIFRDVLPQICRTADGTRPYWRSSPFGSGFPNDESNGNRHQWHVWSAWKDFREYEKDRGRFVTEFGFQAPANLETFEDVIAPEDRTPQSVVMEHHNKQVEGTERLIRFLSAHYRLPARYEDFIYTGQLVQGEALKCGVEHWRRRKFRTAGALFWQLNDCWPVTSWSVLDSRLRPKAGYFFAKRFFAPQLVSLVRSLRGIEVWGVNDEPKPAKWKLTVELASFTGSILWNDTKIIAMAGNNARMLSIVRPERFSGVDPFSHYLVASLRDDTHLLSENRFFFAEPKHLRLEVPTIERSVRMIGEHEIEVTVRSDIFAKNVQLILPDREVDWSDNYFDLDAGHQKLVRGRLRSREGNASVGLFIRSL